MTVSDWLAGLCWAKLFPRRRRWPVFWQPNVPPVAAIHATRGPLVGSSTRLQPTWFGATQVINLKSDFLLIIALEIFKVLKKLDSAFMLAFPWNDVLEVWQCQQQLWQHFSSRPLTPLNHSSTVFGRICRSFTLYLQPSHLQITAS